MYTYLDIRCDTLDAFQAQSEVDRVLEGYYSNVTISQDSSPFLLEILTACADSSRIEHLLIRKSKTMTREEASAIARIVMKATVFQIDSCTFTDETYEIISNAIRSSSTLTDIGLFGNVSYATPPFILRLADGIRDSKSCESLTLLNMWFDPETARRFASCLPGRKSLSLREINGCGPLGCGITSAAGLEALFISYGNLSAPDTRTLCRAMEDLTRLTLHRVVFNHAIFFMALSKNTALKYLCIQDTGVADAIKGFGGLVEVRIERMGLGSTGSLARAIAESKTMRILRVQLILEGIDADANLAIVRAVGANGGIRVLDINGGMHGDAMLYALATAVSLSPHLSVIKLKGFHIRGNHVFGNHAIDTLAKAVATRGRLTEIDSSYPLPHLLTDALERSKANAALLAFCGGILAPRTPLGRLLRKTGDNAVAHRVLGFMITL
jgi:hypothetical protein